MADGDAPRFSEVLMNLRHSAPDYRLQKFKSVLADIDKQANLYTRNLKTKASDKHAAVRPLLDAGSIASSVRNTASLAVTPTFGKAGVTIGQGSAVKALATGSVAGIASAAGIASFVALPVLALWMAAGKVAWTTRKTFKIWDLVPTLKGGKGQLTCTCSKCDGIALDLANRFDVKVAKIAVSAATFGITAVPFILASMTTAVAEEKRTIAVALKLGASPVSIQRNAITATKKAGAAPATAQAWTPDEKPILISNGCEKAQALIAILFGEADGNCRRTAAAILSVDGEKRIMDQIPG